MQSTSVTSKISVGLGVLGALTLAAGCALENGTPIGTGGMALTAGGGTTMTAGGGGGMTSMPVGSTTGTIPTSMAGTSAAGMTSMPTGTTPTGTGGSTTTGSAGSSVDSAGMAGMSAVGTGGAMGSVGGMGGSAPMTGGADTGGMGGSDTGGTGGMGGSTSSGECVMGQTRGDQVVMIGESFIAFTHQITQQVETRAQAAGALPQGERYIDNSVSGTTLANNQIGSQYTSAVQESGDIKYVLMDGGGNDCLINNNGAAALTAIDQLFQTMADNGTEKIVYFFYPDPIGGNFASLKACLDELRPQMKERCDNLGTPKCYWLDLREVWDGHPEYTSDGIHPTTEGSIATGDAIWEVMVENCVAQ